VADPRWAARGIASSCNGARCALLKLLTTLYSGESLALLPLVKSMASEVQWSDARVAQLDEVLRSLNDRLGTRRRWRARAPSGARPANTDGRLPQLLPFFVLQIVLPPSSKRPTPS